MRRLIPLILFSFFALNGWAADAGVEIRWDAVNKTLGISARNAPLRVVLTELSRQTSWRVVIEPGIRTKVTLRTKPRPASQSLKLLVGRLRYQLTPNSAKPWELRIFESTAEAATEAVEVPRQVVKIVPTELAVVVKDKSAAQKLADQFNADLIGFIKGANAARLKFKSAQQQKRARDQIAKVDGVELVDDIFQHPPPVATIVSEGSSNPIRVTPAPVDAKGALIVGLIDSAVQIKGMDKPKFILEQLTVTDPFEAKEKQLTHGTSMASILLRGLSNKDLGVDQSKVRILPIDVFGDANGATNFDVCQGIALAVSRGASIINLSLGSQRSSKLEHRVIQDGHKAGVLFVAAAGNEPVKSNTYPAAYPEVMAVTAVKPDGELTSYANRGDFIDVAERGRQPVRFYGKTYSVNGTSGASAYVSGLAAALASKHGKRPIEIRELIIKNRPFEPPTEKDEN